MQEDSYRGDGLNLYAYVANNPVKYVDPSGFNKCIPAYGAACIMNNIPNPIESFKKAIKDLKYKVKGKRDDAVETAKKGGEKVKSTAVDGYRLVIAPDRKAINYLDKSSTRITVKKWI